jgi:hypothetical protein
MTLILSGGKAQLTFGTSAGEPEGRHDRQRLSNALA